MKKMEITIKKSWGGAVTKLTASEDIFIEIAQNECLDSGDHINGYSLHLGDADHQDSPKYDDEGNQISGATIATFNDAVAWMRHNVEVIKVKPVRARCSHLSRRVIKSGN